jgi:hypothetical protein
VSKPSVILLAVCAALALGAVLWLSRYTPTPEPIVGPPASSAPTPSQPIPDLTAEDSREQRESVGATPASPSQHPPGADSANTATLIVHVVAKETGRPVRAARLSLIPRNANGYECALVEAASATMHESPRPDEHGIVVFTDVLTGEELNLDVEGDAAVASSDRRDVSRLVAGERREMRVELATKDDVAFFGRVVTSRDHRPIEHARVRAVSAGTTWRTDGAHSEVANSPEVLTDRDGYFELSLAKWKSPRVRIEAEGYGLEIVTPTTHHEARDRARVIELEPSSVLGVRVVSADGVPLAAMHVTLATESANLDNALELDAVDWGGGAMPDERWEADTSVDGTCVLADLPARIPLRVEISKDGKIVRRDSNWIVLSPGERDEIIRRIGAHCTINGRAVDDAGQPVGSQEIWLVKCASGSCTYLKLYNHNERIIKATTKRDGRFEMSAVEPGLWCIGPAPPSRDSDEPSEHSVSPLAERLEVGESPLQDIVVHVQRGLYVRGVVLGPTGNALPRAWVYGGPARNVFAVDAASDAKGEFALGPFAPGPVEVFVEGQSPYASSDIVRVEAGARGLLLSVSVAGSMHGHVVDARTSTPCAAEIYVARPHTKEPREIAVATAETGTVNAFEVKGLVPGVYGVVAHTHDGRFGVVTGVRVSPDRDPIDLAVAVSPGGRLRLRYDGRQAQVYVTITSEGVPVENTDPVDVGCVVEELAPVGHLVLEVRNERGETPRSTMTVDLAVGEVKEVVIHDD